MSDDATPHAAEPTPQAKQAAKAPNKLVLPLVIAVMTVVGALAGVLVVGPMVVESRSAVSEGLDPELGDSGAHATAGETAGGGEKGPMFKIDNLIVNPAGSQGTRFLMVSVAVETPDAKMEALLRSREPQIRDVVIAMLERQTMEQLASAGIRDTLKHQLSDTISSLAGSRARLRVFLPQFVIQ